MIDLKIAAEEINEILENKRKELQLTFEEEEHKYEMLDRNGKLTSDFPSVSGIIKYFTTEFDADGKSFQMCNGDLEKQKLLLEQWKDSGTYAAHKGSRVHYELEKYILNKNNINKEVRQPNFIVDEQQIKDGDMMIVAGKQFLDLMEKRGCYFLDSEVLLADNEIGLFGQADDFWLCLNKDKTQIGFIVTDHKSNKIKNMEPQPYNIPMKEPFINYIDYALTHYYVQLPTYTRLFKSMLKGSKYNDIPLLGCIVDSLRDDGTFVEYRVPKFFNDMMMNMDLKSVIKYNKLC